MHDFLIQPVKVRSAIGTQHIATMDLEQHLLVDDVENSIIGDQKPRPPSDSAIKILCKSHISSEYFI